MHKGVIYKDTYTPHSILITGGAGFIGCHFVRHLLSTDAQVRIVNLDLLTYARSLENLTELCDSARHTFVQGDTIFSKQLEAFVVVPTITTPLDI